MILEHFPVWKATLLDPEGVIFIVLYFLCIIGTEHTLKSFIFVVVLIRSRRRPVLNAHIDVT